MIPDTPSRTAMFNPVESRPSPSLTCASWWTGAEGFFFSKDVPYGLALVRMLLPWAIMGTLIRRWPFVREVYSSDGAPSPLADNFGFANWLPELPGTVAVGAFSLMMLLMVTSSIGWMTRFSLLVGGALYTYLSLMDCVSTLTKYTVIVAHLMLLLSLSSCAKVWSVDAWLSRSRSLRNPFALGRPELRFEVWPQRLIQIFIGVVYLGAAITKMHTPSFFSGDQLMYWMMTHIMAAQPLGDLLSQYPALLSVFGYITIVWEIVFVFCVWYGLWRFPLLVVGTIFHIMTAFTLGLLIFPLVMICSYFAFLTEADISWAAAGWRYLRRHSATLIRQHARAVSGSRWWLGSPRPAWSLQTQIPAFVLVLSACTLLAVEIEYRNDLYHERTGDGPLALRELDPEFVRKMLGPEAPLREKDKILALDAGTFVMSDHLVDRRREFSVGDNVIVQTSLNPPREDLWLECDLVDEENKLIHRSGQIAPREAFRTHFIYTLPKGMEPGQYFLVLKSSGEEVTRKRLTVRAAPANIAPPAPIVAN